MTLEEYIDSLPKNKRFELAIIFAKLALPIWDQYTESNELTYQDTVVGMTHTISKDILSKTIHEVEAYLTGHKVLRLLKDNYNLLSLHHYFREPITAMQDKDWELPYPVERTFYAVHNLLESIVGRKITVFNESTIYVSINQAIDALQTAGIMKTDEIRRVIYPDP